MVNADEKHRNSEIKRTFYEMNLASITDLSNGSDGRLDNSPLRKKLNRRAKQQIALTSGVVPKELLKSPSQKKSERARAADYKRAGIRPENDQKIFPSDCRDCQREKTCEYDHNLERCPERSLVLRCRGCGQKVRFRVIVGVAWERCPVCLETERRS